MLFDPKWEAKAKTEPSLAGLLEWLEKQPAEGKYEFYSCSHCLVGKYLRALGHQSPLGVCSYSELFGGLNQYHAIAAERPFTFGAALSRARSILNG